MFSGVSHQGRPQPGMSASGMRPSTPQGPPSARPAFPNPIQRPGGAPVTSAPRPPTMQQQFNGGPHGPNVHPNKSSGGANMMAPNKAGSGGSNMPFNKPGGGMMPPNNAGINPSQQPTPGNSGGGPNPLNMMGGNALLSSLINAAQVIIQGGAPNPYNVKGPGPGGFSGNIRGEGGPPPRQGPHPNAGQGPTMKAPGGPPNQGGPPQQGPPQPNNSSTKSAPGSYPGPHGPSHPNSLKAQQAQQRQAVLNAAASFFSSNSKASGQSKPTTPSSERTPLTSSQSTSSANKTEEKKPALQMVSNPSLVGTSVKINLSASSNTRAPAMSTVSVAPTSKAESITASGKKEESSPEASAAEGDGILKGDK